MSITPKVPTELRATPGARDWEKAARRPCVRHRALVAVGADPGKVAHRIFGIPEGEISEFAIRSGQQHERDLHADNGKRLRKAAIDAGRLTSAENGYLDTHQLVRANPRRIAAVRAERADATAELIRDWLDGKKVPAILSHPTFPFPRPDGSDGYVESDDMLLPRGADQLRNLEVKSFPNLDGFTDPAAMRGLQRQGAVEIWAARETAERVRPGAGSRVPTTVDIVLRNGRLHRDLDVAGPLRQIENIVPELGRSRSGLAVRAAVRLAGQKDPVVDRAFVEALPPLYDEGCRSFCPLASRCRDEAEGRRDPIVLGRAASSEFRGVADLRRLDDLIAGAVPANDDEAGLVAEYGTTLAELARIGHQLRRVIA
jgi:hypothetical protein